MREYLHARLRETVHRNCKHKTRLSLSFNQHSLKNHEGKGVVIAGESRPLSEANTAGTYAELAKRLKKHGFKAETDASITNKLKRRTFSATFFLACIAATELEGVALEEI